jgi:phosphatidate cytidylyltransferase
MGIFVLVVAVLIKEIYTLIQHEGSLLKQGFGILGGVYLFVATFLYAGAYVDNLIFLPYILFLLIQLISGLYIKKVNPISQWGQELFVQFYCAGALSLLCFIPYMGSAEYNSLLLLMIFILIWLNDTGAFLIGSWIGKHRMFERISPLKSWEGFIGGFIISIIASQVLAHYFDVLSWYEWLIFAVLVVIAGTFGDLIESLLKRAVGAKDSGRILPGHGGMFDRFDSAILVSPVIYIYLELIIRN